MRSAVTAAPDDIVAASEQAVVAGEAGRPLRFGRLDAVLAVATEIPAAILVGIEILVLLMGVVSRYVFDRPLTWTDELASGLFLWLAMMVSGTEVLSAR